MSQRNSFFVSSIAKVPRNVTRNAEHTLIFGLGPKDPVGNGGHSDADIVAALDILEDAALRKCGGFTLHRGKGGWVDPDGKTVKEDVIILMIAGCYTSVRELAAIGKKLFGPTAIYVKMPSGQTVLL